jgi:SPP1 family predicted phage head-tail adaptor
VTLSTKLTAGALDRRVVIESRSVTRDTSTGAEVVAWVAVVTVWAQIIEAITASDEDQRSGALVYSRPVRVRILYRSGLDTTMRINYGGRLLQITGTAEIGMRQGIELSCREWSHE